MNFHGTQLQSVVRGRWRWSLLLLLVMTIGARSARAQVEAAISGTINDATGSAIPAASVKVMNVKQVRSATYSPMILDATTRPYSRSEGTK